MSENPKAATSNPSTPASETPASNPEAVVKQSPFEGDFIMEGGPDARIVGYTTVSKDGQKVIQHYSLSKPGVRGSEFDTAYQMGLGTVIANLILSDKQTAQAIRYIRKNGRGLADFGDALASDPTGRGFLQIENKRETRSISPSSHPVRPVPKVIADK